MVFSNLSFAAAIFSFLIALGALLRVKRSLAKWCFVVGMASLAIDAFVSGLILRTDDLWDALRASSWGLVIKSVVAAVWVAFSSVYSRGDFRLSARRRLIPLAILVLLPIGLSIAFHQQLFYMAFSAGDAERQYLRLLPAGTVVNAMILIALVWILMNLEQTFRSAFGTMRWRIKFVLLGLAVVFGGRLYVRTQTLLFSMYDLNWSGVESSALLIGCIFFVLAYVRSGFAEVDVYPSRTVLRSSFTVLVAGVYMFAVGIVANIVRRIGGTESFQFQAFVILLGTASLAVLLLSDRLRQHVHDFVSRHFRRAQHDSVRIWTESSRRLSEVKDQRSLCAGASTLVSELFQVLSVTAWLADDRSEHLIPFWSTAEPDKTGDRNDVTTSVAVADAFRARSSPFDLDAVTEPWAEQLRQLSPTTFLNGGRRWCVPLRAREQTLGTFVLADRVNGASYTVEDLQLLQCIAEQVTSTLLNLRLADELARARELDAFRAISAFFVHDLKNTASLLNLMLKNLPVHFNNPAFRDDALRGIENMTQRIEDMIGRFNALRQQPALCRVETDINQLVNDVLDNIGPAPDAELVRELQPLPNLLVDREQIRSVVTNLILNARDALQPAGCIRVGTECVGSDVIVSVADDGCGMSEEFVNVSLFRPFQSTKKKGLGIGMFQSRIIVEAHGGRIQVKSELGKGTTFRVNLPARKGT